MTFLGTDQVFERSNLLVKIFRKGHFTANRSALVELFCWFKTVSHPQLATNNGCRTHLKRGSLLCT